MKFTLLNVKEDLLPYIDEFGKERNDMIRITVTSMRITRKKNEIKNLKKLLTKNGRIKKEIELKRVE
jgi:hypothetical protein